tara:strand:+ start:837 stop:1772 length:936 start_codon:yes stop_codon:yes gene_type:complete
MDNAHNNNQLRKHINKLIIKEDIAYPTIIVFICNTLFLSSLFMIRNYIPYIMYLLFASISLYVNFTPFHEASHKLIATTKYNYINELIGQLSATIYGTSYTGWKYLHNLHHVHTNHENDPDNFYSNIYDVLVLGPFLDVIYFYNYFKHIHTRPTMEIIKSISAYSIIFSFYYYVIQHNYGSVLFYYYFLPLRFALLQASLVLDYNAHHECPTKNEDSIKSTNKVSGFFAKEDSPLFLSLFMQNQNYHNIHHLFPFVRFYNYQDIWNNKLIREELLTKGTNEINIVPKMMNDSKNTIEEVMEEFKKKSMTLN